jgi:prephenate dehydratase
MKISRVAFQGEPGAYSEMAAIGFFGDDVLCLPCASFRDVFAAVVNETANYGVLPIENSLAGSIHQNYDLLLENELRIIGEYHLRVSHCLLALPGMELEEIHQVRSHPQALAQCAINLRQMGVDPIIASDTAGSARLLAENQEPGTGVLASERAAQVYDLDILLKNMEDNKENYTRFVILTGKDSGLMDHLPGEDAKTSIVFSLAHEPGSLYKALGIFAKAGIDLTKIESRPITGKPWQYMFYIDFAENENSPAGIQALENLAEFVQYTKVLGSYPRHRTKETG